MVCFGWGIFHGPGGLTWNFGPIRTPALPGVEAAIEGESDGACVWDELVHGTRGTEVVLLPTGVGFRRSRISAILACVLKSAVLNAGEFGPDEPLQLRSKPESTS